MTMPRHPPILCPASDRAGIAQLVERQLPKLNVEGSSPFARFGFGCTSKTVRQLRTPANVRRCSLTRQSARFTAVLREKGNTATARINSPRSRAALGSPGSGRFSCRPFLPPPGAIHATWCAHLPEEGGSFVASGGLLKARLTGGIIANALSCCITHPPCYPGGRDSTSDLISSRTRR